MGASGRQGTQGSAQGNLEHRRKQVIVLFDLPSSHAPKLPKTKLIARHGTFTARAYQLGILGQDPFGVSELGSLPVLAAFF